MRTFCCLTSAILVFMFGITNNYTAQTDDYYTGTLSDDTFYQAFAITVAQGGVSLVVTLEATSGDLDTLLYLLNTDGDILAENDDIERGNTNSRIIYPNIDAGDYIIIATRYKGEEGRTNGDFALRIETAPTSIKPTAFSFAPQDFVDAGYPPLDPKPRSEWTIIVYYGGSSNLEPALLLDIEEFERAGGSGDDVRVVVLIDRLPLTLSDDETIDRAYLIAHKLSTNQRNQA